MELEKLLTLVEKPARYVGGEYGLPDFNKAYKLSFCMAFPDLYEVGMSNLGIKILYDILNKQKDIICERVFAPWFDMGELLKKHNISLFSLETRRPLKDFDIIGFSLQYELLYTNVLYMFDLAGIPFKAADRDDSYPIIFAGGPCSANPEPISDFFDMICIGEGEESLVEVSNVVMKYKGNKKKILEECAQLDGIYVPFLAEMKNGIVTTRVKKLSIANIDKVDFPSKPIVPNITVIHDRPVLEIFRGCYAGCRFCQACFFYRPMRVKSIETLVKQAEEMMSCSGQEELGVSSLSTGDYPNISDLISALTPVADKYNFVLSIPSLRLDSYTEDVTKKSRQTGSITFAPEAGTQRLRDVINKNITEEDIENAMVAAFSHGYKSVKLYFMVGLPTETDEDLDGIIELVKKVREIYIRTVGRKDINISVSTSVFVPKPVTPFQWAKQIDLNEMIRRQRKVRDGLKEIKNVRYHWSEEKLSLLEGMFARGDRKLSKLIIEAYKNGAIFDGWCEKFNFNFWEKAIETLGIDVSKYLGEKPISDMLPWDFIDFGVTRKHLEKEYIKSIQEGKTTKSCKYACVGCGANKVAECATQHKKD